MTWKEFCDGTSLTSKGGNGCNYENVGDCLGKWGPPPEAVAPWKRGGLRELQGGGLRPREGVRGSEPVRRAFWIDLQLTSAPTDWSLLGRSPFRVFTGFIMEDMSPRLLFARAIGRKTPPLGVLRRAQQSTSFASLKSVIS